MNVENRSFAVQLSPEPKLDVKNKKLDAEIAKCDGQIKSSINHNPLMRKIKTYRDRTSRELKNRKRDVVISTDKCGFDRRSMRRSKTTSPAAKKRTSTTPKLRRLAASLHLPHYRKRAIITTKSSEYDDWTNRSASLPTRFAYRSSSTDKDSLAEKQRNVLLTYCPSFDGFTPDPLIVGRKLSTSSSSTDVHCSIYSLKQSENFLDFSLQASFDDDEIRHRSRRRPTSPRCQSGVSQSRREVASVGVLSDRATSGDNTINGKVIYFAEPSLAVGVHEKMKQVIGRRLSAAMSNKVADKSSLPPTYDCEIGDVTAMKSRNPVLGSNQLIYGGVDKEMVVVKGSSEDEASDPLCVKQGRVILISGFHVRERYMFLFNDVLLIAKENGVSYAMKEKIKLNELWISSDKSLIYSIGDSVKNVDCALSLGHPTKNFVLEFASEEERNSWFELLKSKIDQAINDEKRKSLKTAIASVQYKIRNTSITRKIAIHCGQTVDELLAVALMKFNLTQSSFDTNPGTSSRSETRKEYQLCVQFGKDSTLMSLFGYERPLALLKAHVRDIAEVDDTAIVDFYVFDESAEFGLTFLLKPKRPFKVIKTKRIVAGQIVNHWKKRVMNSRMDHSHSDSVLSLPPTPSNKLFGVPLDILMPDGRTIPKPIYAIMENVFKEGIFVEGIFRKPPNCRVLREIREKLDAECEVDFDDVQPTVCASLLKDFLRSMPDSLLTFQLLNDWSALVSAECELGEAKEKLEKARNLISRMNDANRNLLMHVLCIFYHVTNNQQVNQMNSHGLSICLGPSLIGNSPPTAVTDNLMSKRASEIMKFLIDNVVEIFGENTLHLFGEVPDQTLSKKNDSSEESDSIGVQLRRATSSFDSLIADGGSPDGSRPHSTAPYASNSKPVNISRDSGLSDLHASSEDFDALLDRSARDPVRSMSQGENGDLLVDYFDDPNRMMTKSVDNLTSMMTSDVGQQPPRSSTLGTRTSNVHRISDIMSQSWHFGAALENNSESSDSLYESLESNCSFEPAPVPPMRKSRRNATNVDKQFVSIVVNSSPVHSDTETPSSHLSLPGGDEACSFSAQVVSRGSPSPISFIDRYSAVRKPARHRKGQAPSPPQMKKLSSDSSSIYDNEYSAPSNESLIQYRRHFDNKSLDSERNSLVANEDVDEEHFAALSTKIAQGLREIREEVLSVAQKNARLSKFSEIVNDSSTLTDTSSEDRTPHVSREGSRAHDCKEIADSMFSKRTAHRAEVRANLRNILARVDPNSATEDQTEKRWTQKIGGSREARRRPPSYHEALEQMQEALVKGSCADKKCDVFEKERLSRKVDDKLHLCRLEKAMHRKCGDIDREVSIDKEHLLNSGYRKSLSDAYGRPASYRLTAQGSVLSPTTQRAKDITWSVKEYVSIFDKNTRSGNSLHNGHATAERLNLDSVRRPMISADNNADLMTASCYVVPSTSSPRLMSLIRLSDSHANYPVVRPPPLTPAAPLTFRVSKSQSLHSPSINGYKSRTVRSVSSSRAADSARQRVRPTSSDVKESFV